MIILYSYTDKDLQFQRETRKAIDELKKVYRVVSRKMIGAADYYNFLCEFWDYEDTLINVEQDIVPSINQIRTLRKCPHSHCTFPYKLGNSPLHADKLCLFEWDEGVLNWQSFLSANATPEFCYGSGIGLVKFEPSIRKTINVRDYPVDVYKWWYLDTFLSQKLVWEKQEPWHCHYPPVKHNHDIYRSQAAKPWINGPLS